ncbi:MAG TPA: ABC transporter ATP-binding protein [Chthoniobacterales bacterium]
MSVVIEASNLSKRFYLGERNQRAFFEDVAAKAVSAARRLANPGKYRNPNSKRDFWALQEVSFQISQGETFAIIGENGAGKSTLLKVLSRITQPTTGTVKVYGRLASLLEVGTGFHPEFSGRDNIYLNGAMLGLSRQEVRARFDRIVDFSGLEQFIEVPVKNYSSGMYVRLAFSVAAHLNPEIVILDEVLAVGDAIFQKKCFDRIEEIINEGHAAILVSHAMVAIRRMSQMCLWLEHGRVKMLGPTHEVVSAYEKQTTHAVVANYGHAATPDAQVPPPEPVARLSGWFVQSKLASDPHTLVSGQAAVALQFKVEVVRALPSCRASISIADVQGLTLFLHETVMPATEPGHVTLTLDLPFLPLKPGDYILTCSLSDGAHAIAVLRATPELNLQERSGERSTYRGLLNLPANLTVGT